MKKQLITIKMKNGHEIQVIALCQGGLAVHRDIHDADKWSITWVKNGIFIDDRNPLCSIAKDKVVKLLSIADWEEITPKDITRNNSLRENILFAVERPAHLKVSSKV